MVNEKRENSILKHVPELIGSGSDNKQSSKAPSPKQLEYSTKNIFRKITDKLKRESYIRIDLYYENKDQTGSDTKYVYVKCGGNEYRIDPIDYTKFIESLQARDDIGYTLYLIDEKRAILEIYPSKKKVLELDKVDSSKRKKGKGSKDGMVVGILDNNDGLGIIEDINKWIKKNFGSEIGQIPRNYKKKDDCIGILYIDLKDLK